MNLIIILTIIFCSGYFLSITTLGSTMTIMAMAVCSLVIILEGVLQRKRKLQGGLLIGRKTFYLTAYLIAIVLFSSGVSSIVGKQVILYFCAMLIVSVCDWNDFKKEYIRVMAVISCFALIGYALQYTPVINMLPTMVNYNGTVYVNGILFSFIKYTYSGLTERLHGLFWEPGLFATYLAIAIAFLKKENTKNYWITLGLFTVCLIMTKSGAGIAMMPLILIIKLTDRKDEELSLRRNVLLCGVLILIFIIGQIGSDVIDQWLNDYLFVKLNDTSNVSNFMRTNAVLVDLQIAWNHFPFGVGIAQYAFEVAKFNSTLQSSGTSTITTYLAEYGVLGIPVVLIWIKALFQIADSRKFVTRLATLLMFLTILTKEPHGNLLFMNCILLYSTVGYRSENDLININTEEI